MRAGRSLIGAMAAALLMLGVLAAGPVGSALAAPEITMESYPPPISKETTPTFGGSTNDIADPVTLDIYKGTSAEGTPKPYSSGLPPLSGKWSETVSPSLSDGTYTAVAEQTELVGLEELTAKTEPPVTFTVDTAPPEVTINQPKSPSGNTKPTFSGKDGDTTNVVVHILNEAATQVETVSTSSGGGNWSTSSEGKLADGTYYAYATQESSLGNKEGESTGVEFTINTASPEVSINQPKSPSNNTKPTFSGKDSDTTNVVVHILNEAATQVETVSTSSGGGNWSTSSEGKLADGTYYAYATQESSLDNPEGVSPTVEFTINTASPEVSINQPKSPSNNTKPTFSGKDSDTTNVVVHILNEAATQVETVSTSSGGGNWSTSSEGKLADGTYYAYATQESSLDNPEGVSPTVEFTINTASPEVSINQPKSPSNNTKPTFSGKDSDTTNVVVHILNEAATQVETVSTSSGGGNWSTSSEGKLADGTYYAYATQESSLDNPEGVSPTVEFTINTASPEVSINQPKSPSNNTKPTFSGKDGDTTNVVVHILNEAATQVETVSTSSGGGNWSTSSEGKLADGTYYAYATQESSLDNPEGVSPTVEFTINTAPPEVRLNQPTTPSNITRPSFTGSASEHGDVTIHVYESHGKEVTSATAAGTGGAWSSGKTSSSLENGEYTAVATQESSLSNGPGHSNTVPFIVNTSPPTVTLNQTTSPTNDTRPFFTGFASEKTTVTVKIYVGSKAEGKPFSEATADGNDGDWVSNEASPALPSGEYTAIAIQPSALENAPGSSEPETFTVETGPPKVKLNQPKSPSKNTNPSFTGEASDHTSVTIDIYAGATAEGPVVSEAFATGNGGKWSSGPANTALSNRQYTAVAVQESSLLGNPTGDSTPVSFIVDTSSPTVSLNPVTPQVSNITKPSFSGTASDTTNVVVHIVNAADEQVETVSSTTSSGHWSTSSESALASETYTAYATQESSLGNPPGESNHIGFTVNTNPPTVTLNTDSVQGRSNDTTPSFNGTASDTRPVVLHVYEGSEPKGTEVADVTATGTATWVTSTVTLATGTHPYTAVATQESSLGNPPGKSNAITFVVDTLSPSVTITQPTTPSSNTKPSFSGKAGETDAALKVTIKIYEEPKENEKKEITALTASVAAGAWEVPSGSVTLATGKHVYSAVVIQQSEVGNNPGESAPVKFTVDTTAPTVTLNPVATSPSNNTLPTFTGTASDTKPVTVTVYEGNKPEGKVASTATAKEPKTTWTEANTSWTSAAVTPALPAGDHEYTAVATQESSLDNPTGKSSPITFTVDTTSPVVTITSPLNASVSNNTSPIFTGTASGTDASTEVSIKIYEGTPAEAKQITSTTATVKEGKWTSGTLTSALGNHLYTAVASVASLLGNKAGSAEVAFTINTLPPTVTLDAPPSPSNNNTPTLEGTASETTPVSVKIYENSKKAEGKLVDAVETTPAPGGAWTAKASLPSKDVTYTAIAVEKSAIGNPEGKSNPVTFVIDPLAPTVTLNAPPALSDDNTPSFTGIGTSTEGVTINIYGGARAEGTPVAKVTAKGTGGPWTSGPVTPPLLDGEYSARAEQSVPGHLGVSNAVTFTIDTVAPQIKINSPSNGSSSEGESEQVTGTAGIAQHDLPGVTVQLFSGAAAAGAPVQSISVTAVAGAWSATFGGLGAGTYTARAVQSDEAGNVGVSNTATFTITRASPPPAPAHAAAPPAASFSWFPSSPKTGESISLASNSTDSSSPIVAFAWDLAGTGAFAPSGPTTSTLFSTAGNHVVQLRVTDANGLSSVATEAIPVIPRPLPLMQPFPVVRITSIGTRSGIRLRLLSVTALAGATITIECKGRGCPVKFQRHVGAAGKARSAIVEFRRFERSLPAGVTIEIRITKPGAIGKYTRITIRRGKLPIRFDACLDGVATKPVTCPAS